MDEMAEKKPREEAVKAFRHKAYTVDMGKDGSDGQQN